jgi:hypothetical protein
MRNGNAKVSRTCAPSNRYGGHTRLDQRRCSAALSGHHLSKIATKARRSSRPASRQRLPTSPLRTRCGRGGHRPAPGDLHAGSPLVSRAKRVACSRFLQELSPTTCRLQPASAAAARDVQKQYRAENNRNLMNAECIALHDDEASEWRREQIQDASHPVFTEMRILERTAACRLDTDETR